MAGEKKAEQTATETADVILIVIDREERVSDINRRGCDILGYTREEIIGKNWFDAFVPPPVAKEIRPFFRDVLRGASPPEYYESPILTRDRRERLIRWHAVLRRDASGDVDGMVSSGEDVTGRQEAEDALRASEKRFRTTLDAMLEGCQVIDFNWRYAYVNDAAAKQGRRTTAELLGHTMMEMYPGIQNTPMFDRLKDCMDNRISHQMENEFAYPDGSLGWFDLRIEPVPDGILVLSQDITERKLMEAERARYHQRLEEVVALRTAEYARANAKLEQEIEGRKKAAEGLNLRAMILDNAREAIFLINSDGDFVYSNEAGATIYGYTVAELLTMNIRQALPPQQAPVIAARLQEAFRTGRLEFETIHLRKDGRPIKVQARHSLIKTLHGRFVVTVVRDITEEKQVEESLRRENLRARSMLEQIPALVWTTDTDLKVTSVTGTALERLGMNPADLQGTPLDEVLKRAGLGEEIMSAARSALLLGSVSFTVTDGTLRKTWSGRAAPMRDEKGTFTGTIGVLIEAR